MNAEALIGTELGTCTLQKLLGQGGMGAVFLAQQSRPRRQVAVKVLLPMSPLSQNQKAAFLERFRRETDVVASLEHPNIMPVHEYGERDGLAYLVMPYISGGTLREEMERVGQLPLEQAVFYLEQMAAALEFAHERGVIHRDVKPANILVRREGRLLLTDFGLVKIVSEEAGSRLTGVGVPMGTPDYMAPEQVMGSEIDMRADLYSLGVLLYQMVTGTLPFKGDVPMQVAIQQMQMPPLAPRSLRPTLPIAAEHVMLRALAKRPQDRYMHVQEFASAFRLALLASGVSLPDFSGILAPGVLTDLHIPTPYSLLDPIGQGPTSENGNMPAGIVGMGTRTPQMPPMRRNEPRKDIVGKTSMPMPSLTTFLSPETPNPPAPPVQGRNTLHSYLRPGMGHKLNLQSTPQTAESQSEGTPPQHYRQDTPPLPLSDAPVAPPVSDFGSSSTMPTKRLGLRSMLSLSSNTSEPSSTSLLGKSGLRSLPSFVAEGSGISSLASVDDADLPPQKSFNGTSLSLPFASSSQFASQQAEAARSQMSPSQAPEATATNGQGWPLNPSTTQSLSGTATNGLGWPPNPLTTQSLNGTATNGQGWPPNPSTTRSLNGEMVSQSGSQTTQQLGGSGMQSLTGALVMGNIGGVSTSGNTSMMKLIQPTKVIQVPVAGQPGRYITSLLPVLEESKPGLPPHIADRVAKVDSMLNGHLKAAILLVAVVLVIVSSSAFVLIRSQSKTTVNTHPNTLTGAQNVSASATAGALATATANVILSDPLDGNGGNIHNMPLATKGSRLFMFKDNAYHVTANTSSANALLPTMTLPNAFTYALTVQAIKGNEDDAANSFGLIVRYSTVVKQGNKKVTTFYSLEAVNKKGGQYQFWKYDDSQGTADNKAWHSIWQKDEGNEFHIGHGANSKNVFNILVNGGKFTFVVNGKNIGSAQDNALTGSQVGMFVNLPGTEVAFSNLALTYN